MATILAALRSAEAKAKLAQRASNVSIGVAAVLDMGSALAVYRRALVRQLASMPSHVSQMPRPVKVAVTDPR